jgi:hypothetical protein
LPARDRLVTRPYPALYGSLSQAGFCVVMDNYLWRRLEALEGALCEHFGDVGAQLLSLFSR